MKINILFVIPKLGIGGAERQLLHIIRGINMNHFSVWLAVFNPEGELVSEFRGVLGERLIILDKHRRLSINHIRQLNSIIIANSIQIVHAFLAEHHVYPLGLYNRDIKIVAGIRSSYMPPIWSAKGMLSKLPVKKLVKNEILYFASNNHLAKKQLIERNGTPRAVYIIPNGIDLCTPLKRSKRIKRKNNGTHNLTIGNIGRINSGKNHMDLLKSFQILRNKYKDLQLVIAGDGPYRDRLVSYTDKQNYAQYVHFVGLQRDVGKFMRSIDIFAFPSKFPEGWPNVIGEAMACGVPVVSYPVGDVDKIIKSGENGLICNASPESMANSIDLLVRDRAKRIRIGLHGRDTIKKHFTVKKMVLKYEKMYKEILKRK